MNKEQNDAKFYNETVVRRKCTTWTAPNNWYAACFTTVVVNHAKQWYATYIKFSSNWKPEQRCSRGKLTGIFWVLGIGTHERTNSHTR